MPNWIQGSLKARGSLDDVKRFLSEGVEALHYSEIQMIDNGFKLEEYDNGYFEVSYEIPSDAWLYFADSSRAFPDETNGIILIVDEDTKIATVHILIRQAWGFDYDYWADISKKYNIELKLYGVECGMQFTDDLEIKNGEITKSDGKSYKKYCEFVWEVPFPKMGG